MSTQAPTVIYTGTVKPDGQAMNQYVYNDTYTCGNGASLMTVHYDLGEMMVQWDSPLKAYYQPMAPTTLKNLIATYDNNPNVTISFKPIITIQQKDVENVNTSVNLLIWDNNGNQKVANWNYYLGNYCKSPAGGMNPNDTCNTALINGESLNVAPLRSDFACLGDNSQDCSNHDNAACCGSDDCFTSGQQFDYPNRAVWNDFSYPVKFRPWILNVCNSLALCNGGACTCNTNGQLLISMYINVTVAFACTSTNLEDSHCIQFCEQASNESGCMDEYNDYCGGSINAPYSQMPINIAGGGCRQFYRAVLRPKGNLTTNGILSRYCQQRYSNLAELINDIDAGNNASTASVCACNMKTASYSALASSVAKKFNDVNPVQIQGACLINKCVQSAFPSTRWNCAQSYCVNVVAISNQGSIGGGVQISQNCSVNYCNSNPSDPFCTTGNNTPNGPPVNPPPHNGHHIPKPPPPPPNNTPSSSSSKWWIWVLVIGLVLIVIIIIIVIATAVYKSTSHKQAKYNVPVQLQ